MVCLALELVGPWVVLGFIVGMKAFDVLEKTLESPLDYKEIKSVNPKINRGNHFGSDRSNRLKPCS